MTFQLTILGSSSALPTSKRNTTAQVLNVHERFFLIDCGEGTQIQLRRYKMKLGRINHIFLSHLHGDHVFGLFGLLSSYNMLGRKTPLHIYAPPDVMNHVDFFKKNFAQNLEYDILVHPIKRKSSIPVYEDKNLEVFSIPLKHRVPTFGFLFREKIKPKNIRRECIEKYDLTIKEILKIKAGEDLHRENKIRIPNHELTYPPYRQRSYAFISDTRYYEKIISLVSGVNILYHESTFLEKDENLAKKTLHSTARDASLIAQKAGVERLLIGHFSSRYKDVTIFEKEAREIFPETVAVKDGDVFSIEMKRVQQSN